MLSRSSNPQYPERVLQFGGGAFLRGFVDWMIHRLNQANLFNGSIVLVESTGRSNTSELLASQNNLYTLLTRGLHLSQTIDHAEIITSISRAICAPTHWPDVLACARNPDLRFIVSNTTEAGITLSSTDELTDSPPASFPAKLAAILYERYQTLPDRGFIILPCELIDDNGSTLKRIVLDLANRWSLPADFLRWIDQANIFCNTLVDRIVTGYPKDDAPAIQDRLGYTDPLLDVAEPFHFFAIEAPPQVRAELPFDQVGLNVAWASDISPYRTRKVRILNGAHTLLAPAGFLAGKETVLQCIQDPAISHYLHTGLFTEILPALDIPPEDAHAFAQATLERFANPFLKHKLLSIALNSTSKFKVRLLPTLRASLARRPTPPPVLTFSLAALIAFYRGAIIQDDPRVLQAFQSIWSGPESQVARRVLGLIDLWGEDLNALPGLTLAVEEHLHRILTSGAAAALREATEHNS